MLVPAGLIRSQGTGQLRRFLFDNASELSVTVLENRARFFAIDTRFKFLRLALTKAATGTHRHPLGVFHATGDDRGVKETGRARLSRNALETIRPDLTIPEVRSDAEWRLFRRMSEHAVSTIAADSAWRTEIVREIDMTRDRAKLSRVAAGRMLPVIEGRMVHQHRFGAKAYSQGMGRRSRWDPVPPGARRISPQFWCAWDNLAPPVRKRASSLRVGFCDITGQTNERSMLAALIQPRVVCGNKVPTVTFPLDESEARLFIWLAVANSFTFDWALRRVVTTTVNYFVLHSVPFPAIDPGSAIGRRLMQAARKLHAVDVGRIEPNPWRVAHWRASIDILVHGSYGLTFKDLELALADFPLLDRGQPPIGSEGRSTVTRDFLLSQAARHFGGQAGGYAGRLRAARRVGAIPYVPSEFVSADIG